MRPFGAVRAFIKGGLRRLFLRDWRVIRVADSAEAQQAASERWSAPLASLVLHGPTGGAGS